MRIPIISLTGGIVTGTISRSADLILREALQGEGSRRMGTQAPLSGLWLPRMRPTITSGGAFACSAHSECLLL